MWAEHCSIVSLLDLNVSNLFPLISLLYFPLDMSLFTFFPLEEYRDNWGKYFFLLFFLTLTFFDFPFPKGEKNLSRSTKIISNFVNTFIDLWKLYGCHLYYSDKKESKFWYIGDRCWVRITRKGKIAQYLWLNRLFRCTVLCEQGEQE